MKSFFVVYKGLLRSILDERDFADENDDDDDWEWSNPEKQGNIFRKTTMTLYLKRPRCCKNQLRTNF